jgi:hypothetical protein
MGFLPEDYVVFLDESGNDTLQVVAGVFIPVRWTRPASVYLDDFRATEGVRQPEELKAAELATGRGVARRIAAVRPRGSGIKPRAHELQIGHDIYTRALATAGYLNRMQVVCIGVPTRVPAEAYRLWFWAVCAGLTASRGPTRPRVSLVVIDGEDQGFLRVQRGVVKDFYLANRRRQSYVGPGTEWFIGGAVLHESHSLPFVQMADLVAHAAFQNLLGNPKRAFMHTWYEDHLRTPARLRHRRIDVSAFCLAELANCNPPAAVNAHAAEALIVR